MSKQTVEHPYNEILFSAKKKYAATVENSMEFPQKTKHETVFWPGSSTAGIIL